MRSHNLAIGGRCTDDLTCGRTKVFYRYRHLVESIFARLKHYPAIATRNDKLQKNDANTLTLACSIRWLTMWVD
jgi:transposase